MDLDVAMIQQALEMAATQRGNCAPNPAVGAVVVKDGAVIGRGAHRGCGHPHAEPVALDQAGDAAKRATLYVTLEPCSHYGRTPPCTKRIIESGIKKVVYSYKDPNPTVSGNGHEALVLAGVEVVQLAVPSITSFYQSYSRWLQTGYPWVTAKLALSLDGKIAGFGGKRINITGPELKDHTNALRKEADAILTTAKTIIHDDPLLQAYGTSKRLYIADRCCKLTPNFQIWTNSAPITLFYASGTPQLEGVRYVRIREQDNKLCIDEILQQIGKDGMHDLWVEAGGQFVQSLLDEDAVNELYLYTASKWLGSQAQPAFATGEYSFDRFIQKRWYQVGDDVVCNMTTRGA